MTDTAPHDTSHDGVRLAPPAVGADPQRDAEPGRGERERPHMWRTLGYQQLHVATGTATIGWDAPLDYSFPSASGPIVQGGLVTALLDAAMGGACWTVLDPGDAFLTADLRVEFLRPTRPGELHATGTVVRRTRRVVFCAAELFDAGGVVLAASRCTQVVLPGDGGVARAGTPFARAPVVDLPGTGNRPAGEGSGQAPETARPPN